MKRVYNMNLRKRFSGQYTLICMFAAFIIFTLIVGIIVQLQNIRDYKEEIYTLKYELNSTNIYAPFLKQLLYNFSDFLSEVLCVGGSNLKSVLFFLLIFNCQCALSSCDDIT